MTVGIFAREGPFRSKMGISQVVSQLRNGLGGLRNGTRVPGGGFAGEGLWLRNLALEGFAAHFIATKWAFGLQNGTRVPERCFAGGGACGCEMISYGEACFAAKPQFRSMVLLAAKWFCRGSLLL